MTVSVTSMRMRERPTVTPSGARIVAYFSGHDDNIALQGMQLVMRADGSWNVWPPTLTGATRRERKGAGRGVHWRAGGTMKARFLDAGVAAYRALRPAPGNGEAAQ